ncbi:MULTISPECIES: glycosyltransferase family 4 protein [unclassified Sphingobium]|uniref:glycosyltransferase family 4 protein n=1 Tax=unclassified Sphingobium TaxID=2611147 RepID=UPI0022259E2B|nr:MULTISPECIES: glycosyltransferase [unclassified Sphingobium]MCW2411474.1 glycosyltransferase involved in cell wall biosynthesis [Sphingobium sp. B8D3D]MCW2416233.1 glycosyltransferase involved in cell wall biosynthesis [Sphingobium sp. B8D3A]
MEDVASKPLGGLLLILPLLVHQYEGDVFIEQQAANGLHQWIRHFGQMTLCVKVVSAPPPADSVSIAGLGLGPNLTVELMPRGWTPLSFAKAYPEMRAKLSRLIDSHAFLHCALGGAWGDWAAVAALMAARRGRKVAVWTDRVESEVMRIDALRASGVRRFVRLMNASLARRLERRAIGSAALGLFHGNDCYQTYRGFNANPFLVHDIHLKPHDKISDESLNRKIRDVEHGPLRLIYIGRFHPDKGVMDWIETLRLVKEAGVAFHAQWFGDGPQREEARAKVLAQGLEEQIEFPGLLVDRSELLDKLRAAHLMPFCHLTPESPRNLIEALASGTPIVGYESAYPQDLISGHGGGVLTPMDPQALAAELVRLGRDRAALAALIGRAAQDGAHMNDEAVFAHRASLMKLYCRAEPRGVEAPISGTGLEGARRDSDFKPCA